MGKKPQNGPPIKSLKGAGWGDTKFEKKSKLAPGKVVYSPLNHPSAAMSDYWFGAISVAEYAVLYHQLPTDSWALNYFVLSEPPVSYANQGIRLKIANDTVTFLDRWKLSDDEWDGVYQFYSPEMYQFELAEKAIPWIIIAGIIGQSHYDPQNNIIINTIVLNKPKNLALDLEQALDPQGSPTVLWWLDLRRDDKPMFRVNLQGAAADILETVIAITDAAI